MAWRTLETTTSGTPRPSGRSHTSATAPRFTASGAKSCPSARKPGTQKNSEPASTSLLEYARLVMSTSGAPPPVSSRRVIAGEDNEGVGAAQISLRRDLEIRERERQDLLEGRGRHDAAEDRALRLVDHHRNQQARVASRREADEGRHVLELRVAAVHRVR